MSFQKVFSFLANQRFLIVAISVLGIILLISLPNRALQSDENWFGEQAYWLLHEGQVKLKSIPLIFEWDEQMLVHHKLLTWSGWVIIKLFGWSVYPLRIFIFLLALLTGYFMFLLTRVKGTFLTKKHFLIAILLLILTPEFVIRVFFFRPEILVMCFGVGAYYFISRYYHSQRLLNAGLAGFMSGMAFVSHLNALVFPIAGFLIFVIFKKWKAMIAYGIVCFSVCLIYTEGLWNIQNLDQYFYELKNWPSHSFEDKVDGGVLVSIWNNILGLLGEHKRYFWDQDVWLISGMFFLSLIFSFKYIKTKEPVLLTFLLVLMVVMGLVSGGHAPRYLMYIFPFMTYVIALSICRVWEQKAKAKQLVFVIVLAGQLSILSLAYIKIFNEKTDHVAISDEILSHVPVQSHVIGPWDLIYNNIGQYHLYNYKSYEYLEEKMSHPFTQLELLKDLKGRQVDYLIIDERMKKDEVYHWFSGWSVLDNPYYELYHQSECYLILKRQTGSL